MAAAPPFVGPREGDRAARAFLECGADVHRGDVRLAGFALADAVRAGFGEQQRLVPGDVLQPREIGAQLGFAVQVHVERADIEERQVEEFGRRKIDVREEAVGRRGLRVFVETAQEALHAQPAVPPHDAGRDLVAEREQRDRRMAAELAHPRDRLPPDVLLQPAIVEKRDMLRPRQPDHDAKPLGRGRVEQVAAGGV